MRYLTTTQAAAILQVSPASLRVWEIEGLLIPVLKTPGGHRKYTRAQLRKFWNSLKQENTHD